jgi:hypothetical protein
MKRTLIIGSLLVCALHAQAQGYLNWNDNGSWAIGFYSPDVINPGVVFTGDSPQDVPGGTTTYTGGWIGGGASPGNGVGTTPTDFYGINYQNASSFQVGLYMDTTTAALTADIQFGSALATDTIIDGGLAGIATEAEDPNVAPGTDVYLGLAAWYTDGGLDTSYAAAVAANQPAGYNISTGTVALGRLTGTPVSINGSTIGLTSFSVAAVPEPSTFALGLMGASAFFMRLRRKQ